MENFTKEQKRIAIDLFYREGQNSTSVVKTLGYPSATSLMLWVREDPRWKPEMDRSGYIRIAFEDKLAAVQLRLEGRHSLQAIADMYGVCASNVCRWTKKYLKGGQKALEPEYTRNGQGFHSARHDIMPASSEPAEVDDGELRKYCEDLKFENDVLRAELDYLSKKYQASASRRSIIKNERE